jgi:putative phosphoserine phosphatase/1-acylglycerol-3-phosphate O-acyltransferase
VAIITSATIYQVRPAARDLGIEHVLHTKLEVEKGYFTGSVIHPTCFGDGKVAAAEALAAKHGIELAESFFYSDSDDDIQLLQRVGKPRPLNPNARLTTIAEQHGWPVRRFGSRSKARASDWVRSLFLPASLVGSFIAGVPIWALTGSRREALNFSVSVFADTIRDIPIIGRVLEAAGVVLIDRKNTASAIASMSPLVDAMRVEGKSVALSPEGTRSITDKLAPFKKGAFHLAMQAGVPIVPVVIHNSGDVQPKGDFLYHPGTVHVEVLRPVDTSSWSVETIDKHVAEIRQLYLAALRQ